MEYLHTMAASRDLPQSLIFSLNKLGLVERGESIMSRPPFHLVFLSAPGDLDRRANRSALIELTYNGIRSLYGPAQLRAIWPMRSRIFTRHVTSSMRRASPSTAPRDGAMASSGRRTILSIELLQKGEPCQSVSLGFDANTGFVGFGRQPLPLQPGELTKLAPPVRLRLFPRCRWHAS